MNKQIRTTSIVTGYSLFVLAIILPGFKGTGLTYSLFGVWFRSIASGDFWHFWQQQFLSGFQAMLGAGLLVLLVGLSFAEAARLTAGKVGRWLPRLKTAALFFAAIGVAFLEFFQMNFLLLVFPGLAFIEFMLLRYFDGKAERDREYEQNKREEEETKRDKQERLAFKGSYPKLFQTIIRKNLLYYRKDLVILVAANWLSYLSIALLLAFYRSFAGSHSQESIFDKSGLLRIFIESGGILFLLLVIFLTYINGTYLSFKNTHSELWILLGIRRKTFLWMLLREYILAGGLAIGLGTIMILPFVRGDVTAYLWALLIQIFLAVLTLAFHQERILRMLQFKQKVPVKVKRKRVKWAPVWLLLGVVFLTITFWWFGRRKSSETYFVFAPLIVGLLGIVYGGMGLFIERLKRRSDYFQRFLTFTDFFYQFGKSANLMVMLILLQVFSLGILIPRIVTYQMTDAAALFPYEIVAKLHPEDVHQVQEIGEKYQAEVHMFPVVPITSVDGDPDPEMYGTQRPVMFIQGQHVGVSETTYQLLRQEVGLEKRPLHLTGDQWHVVYQQAVSVQAQPIDWDPGSSLPRLRIGQPLEEYNTMDVDNIFPMRNIHSQERAILTGMFQRGLQENVIVLPNEAFQEAADRQPEDLRQLALIQVVDAKGMLKELNFLSEKYAEEQRWDASVLPVYGKEQRQENVVTENSLELLVLVFLTAISLLLCFSLLLTKYVSEKSVWQSRQDLLCLLGIRESERRKLLNSQLRLFFCLPGVLAGLISFGFILTMLSLRFFEAPEVVGFVGRLFLVDSFYALVWYGGYRWCGNQMMKWVTK
ncbi:hypothetical protein JZO70_08330 [Enterococcus sp. 669A]|uniref:ABC3 transporter permease protein domain-containing protein n=1 Tax=Candidatus Enterococcus moelleringii TaxID=2815325 RepID=A0ABS3L945_9ENTE|nr:hypothetical protein [Enterococcus sp. 669A]MBO1306164.1 hypothetical protein [Enterococcus sp. 669A]